MYNLYYCMLLMIFFFFFVDMASSSDRGAVVLYKDGMKPCNEITVNLEDPDCDPFSLVNRLVYDGGLRTGLIKVRLVGKNVPKSIDVSGGISSVCKALTTEPDELKSYVVLSYKAVDYGRVYKKTMKMSKMSGSFADFEERLVDAKLWAPAHPKDIVSFQAFWRQLG